MLTRSFALLPIIFFFRHSFAMPLFRRRRHAMPIMFFDVEAADAAATMPSTHSRRRLSRCHFSMPCFFADACLFSSRLLDSPPFYFFAAACASALSKNT